MKIKNLIDKHVRREKAQIRKKRNADSVVTDKREPIEWPSSFDDEVMEQAQKIYRTSVDEDEIIRRRDFRDILTFTIDPENAKDFDDALSFQVLDDGVYQVGIHIADVTYYVPEHSPIDDEAYRRGNSVYLVDKVIPMLPEQLCNSLCSLREGEDKLCMSVVVELDENAKVLRHKVCRTIIRSNVRLDYARAQRILDGQDKAPAELTNALEHLMELARVLRSERFRHGAINFEHEEVCFHLDALNHPTDIYFHPIYDSNHLIEEFMLLANRLVASDMGKWKEKPFVYRVHDNPDPEKMVRLSKFVRQFGVNVKADYKKGATLKQINSMLSSVKGMNCQTMVETLTIRAMAKAVYSTDNIGHYGLCFPYYTHFTSPIRRYPDMMVHRLVAHYILGQRGYSVPAKEDLEQACVHCSDMELAAQQAERDSIRQMQTLWMEKHIGEVFDGIITGIAECGMFVQLTNTLTDGLVPMRTLTRGGDWMQVDEENYCLISALTGKTYMLSDSVQVKVVRVDTTKNLIDFVLVEENEW